MLENNIIFYDGKYWVCEITTTDYPWSIDSPAYFGSPIYMWENWKLEMRRAWANWIRWEFSNNFTKNEIKEIRESIAYFLEFCKKMMGDFYHDCQEKKTFEKYL